VQCAGAEYLPESRLSISRAHGTGSVELLIEVARHNDLRIRVRSPKAIPVCCLHFKRMPERCGSSPVGVALIPAPRQHRSDDKNWCESGTLEPYGSRPLRLTRGLQWLGA
jgi:hypothetical protein